MIIWHGSGKLYRISNNVLPEFLVDRVLEKLELTGRPEPTLPGLSAVYSAWCRHVPFDNIRKLIHVRGGDPGVLPGDAAGDFFDGWLRFGAGGTCWAGNGALSALLVALGFAARRAVGTMLVAPNLPPNHGSVTVLVDERRYLVDASILHHEPLLLAALASPHEPTPPVGRPAPGRPAPGTPAASARCAWSVAGHWREGHWYIRWRPLHKLDGLDCRIDRFDAEADIFSQFHEQSRAWSPFNYSLYVRTNGEASVKGAAFGQRVDIDASGAAAQRPLRASERIRFLVEEIGIHEELAAMVPPDLATPPPPGSAVA
jgi:N-hydroxyarylamine O-acetyltransferase